MNTALWPLGIYFAAVMLIVGSMLGLSFLLGERHQEKATNQPFESGILVTGSARLRFPVTFYLVAMLFLIFDVESVFIFAWAVSARALGWPGYAGMLVFVGALIAALIYLGKVGALEAGPTQEKHHAVDLK